MSATATSNIAPTAPRRFVVAARLRGLSLACFVLYALAQLGTAVAGWVEYVAEQLQHGSSPMILGDDGYAWTFLEQTLQNWQSEFLALAVLIALTSKLLHVGSKHSRDGNDEAKAKMQSIQARVERLAGSAG